MTALKDTRPHVFRELQIDPGADIPEDGPYAALVGRLVGELLDTWPDIDLPTIRIGHHTYDGRPTIRVDARRGQLAAAECPQCHQVAGRPHTEYCSLAVRPGAWHHRDECPDLGSCEHHAITTSTL